MYSGRENFYIFSDRLLRTRSASLASRLIFLVTVTLTDFTYQLRVNTFDNGRYDNRSVCPIVLSFTAGVWLRGFVFIHHRTIIRLE